MCTNKPFWELVAKLIQNPSETLPGLLLFVVVFLATGLWGVSKSWGGDVPTTDMEPSGPILVNCYIAIILIPAPPFFPLQPMSAWGGYLLMLLPSLPFQPSCLYTGSFTDLGITCFHPRIPRPVAPCIRLCYLSAYPVLTTLAGFPTLRPCRLQSLF